MLGRTLVFLGAAGAALSFDVDASACSYAAPSSGYVSEVRTGTQVVDDPSTAVLCNYDLGTCGTQTVHRGYKRVLFAEAIVSDPKPSSYIDGTNVTYRLKNGADAVLAEKTGTQLGVEFDELGAKVCVVTSAGDAGGEASELCSAVTVTSIELTDQDRADREKILASTCDAGTNPQLVFGNVPVGDGMGGGAGNKSADGGANNTLGSGGGDGGCSASPKDPTGAAAALPALALAIACAIRFSRRRR